MNSATDYIRLIIIALILCLGTSETAPGQVADSTFMSYDWLAPSMVSAKSDVLRVKGDTTVFGTSNLLLHEGASLDAILMEIPGLSIDARGNVTVNGRPVRELLVEGKRFFGTDVAAGLRNIPAGFVGSVRTYEKDSDLGSLSGVDQADKDMVIDVSIKSKFKGRFGNSLKTAGGWQNKYDGRYNGTLVTEKAGLSLVGGSDNLGAIQKSSGTGIRTGLGENSGKRQSEAGITASFPVGKADVNAGVLYKTTGRISPFTEHSDYLRTSGYHYTEGGGLKNERDRNITAQGTLEWKKSSKIKVMLKPLVSYSTNSSADSLGGSSFRDTSSAPYYTNLRHTDDDGGKFKAGSSFILTVQPGKKGRKLTLNIDSYYSREEERIKATTDMNIFVRNRVIHSWRDRECVLNTGGTATKAQIIYSEPVSRHHSLQVVGKYSWDYENVTRDNTILDDGTPVKDLEQCSSGRYDYMAGDLSLAWRMAFRKLNLTLGVSAIPEYSKFSFVRNQAQEDTSHRRTDIAPRIVFNYTPNEHNALKFTYKGYPTHPSARQILPVAANTNPVYIYNPNPGLRPAFNREMNLTWKVSDSGGRKGFSAGVDFKTVKDGFSTHTETNPNSSGRVVTPVNVDGNLAAGIDLSGHIAKGDFVFTGHGVANLTRKRSYLFDDVAKISELCTTRTGFVRQTFVATYRITGFELNALAEGEVTAHRIDLRPDMDQTPIVLSAGASATWRAGMGWMLSADMKESLRRGYALERMNRNYLIINSKISKSLAGGKIVLQLDARDILRQWDNVVCSMTSERRTVSVYGGSASYIIGRAMFIF